MGRICQWVTRSLYADRVRLFCSDPTLLPDIKTIEFVFAEGRNHLRILMREPWERGCHCAAIFINAGCRFSCSSFGRIHGIYALKLSRSYKSMGQFKLPVIWQRKNVADKSRFQCCLLFILQSSQTLAGASVQIAVCSKKSSSKTFYTENPAYYASGW